MWNELFGTEEFQRSLNLSLGLGELLRTQKVVSGLIPGHVTDPVINRQVMLACFALQGEVFELAQELGWKDWKGNKEMTKEQTAVIAEEFADILAFLGYLMILVETRTGLSVADISDAYMAKSKKNIDRFHGVSGEEGYTGVVELDGDVHIMDWWSEVPGTAADAPESP
jgi:NTP pyrophosphatase (non-canonical NTP hydrolase)